MYVLKLLRLGKRGKPTNFHIVLVRPNSRPNSRLSVYGRMEASYIPRLTGNYNILKVDRKRLTRLLTTRPVLIRQDALNLLLL